MSPELDPRRAQFVPGRIDEILTWERTKEKESDLRFVELGVYLCEVRSRQYWRLEKLSLFEEFLEKRFPESRRKAYYLMAIHENLTRIPKPQLREAGWSKAVELVKAARRDGENFDCATRLHREKGMPKEGFKGEVELLRKSAEVCLTSPFGWSNRVRCVKVFPISRMTMHHIKLRSKLHSHLCLGYFFRAPGR